MFFGGSALVRTVNLPLKVSVNFTIRLISK